MDSLMTFSFLINSLNGGGTEKVCRTLSNELTKKGYQIDLYVLSEKECVLSLDDNVNVIFLGKYGTIGSLPHLYKVIKNIKTNSILVFNHELALILLLVKAITRSKLNIISRMNNTFSKTIKFKKVHYRIIMNFIMKLFYRYVDYYIYQSTGIKNDLVNNYSASGNFSLIANPIDIPDLLVNKSNKKNKRKLLYVGRLVKQKNIFDLLCVFQSIYENNKDISLIIVGSGPEKESLEKYCLNNTMLDAVEFVGRVENVGDYYGKADVTVLTSFNEGFPNVLLESIANGTPVVSYDCPSGPSEIIIDGVNGFLVEHLDREKMKSSILKSLELNWECDLLINSIDKFKSENIVRQYESVLKLNEKK